MPAAWFQFRVTLRQRWVAWTSIAILTGLVSGVVMVAIAGARRTDSSLHRVVVESRAPDLFVGLNVGLVTPRQLAQLEHFREVDDYSYVQGVAMVTFKHGQPDLTSVLDAVVLTNPDGHELHSIDRAGIVAGHIPPAGEVNALVVNEAGAASMHLHVGQRLRVGFADVRELDNFDGTAASLPKLHEYTLELAGIVRTLDDAPRAADDPRLSPHLFLTQALARRVAGLGAFYDGLNIRLHDPAQVPAYESAVRRALGANVLNFQELRGTLERARRATRPYVLALWLFAGLALLAGTAVVGQLVTRQRRLESASRPVLRALGATRSDVVRAATLRALFVGMIAAAVAIVVAIVGSRLMPIGPLRILEPHRGVDIDVTVVLAGAALVVVLMTVYSAIGAGITRAPGGSHRYRMSDAVAGSGAPLPVVTGVRLAFDPGRGDATIPVRSTVFGVGVAIAALVATLVYASSLTHFTSTPRMYGWIWSYQLEARGEVSVADLEAGAARVARDPQVRAVAIGAYAQLTIAERTLGSVALQSGRGVAVAQIVRGREPQSSDELAFGATTLHDLRRSVGDRITVRVGGVSARFRIVGQAVFPRFAPYPSSEPTGLGVGVAMTIDGLARFGPLDTSARSPVAATPYVLVNARPGARASHLRQLMFGDDPTAGVVFGAQRPNDVSSYQHLERTPLALAGILVVLAIATMVHLLVSAVRRRRRELGVLRALGFTASQLRRSVVVQATVLIGLALAVAVPAGVASGRVLWELTSKWLGIPVHQVVPLGEIALVVFGALGIGGISAVIPAISAGRVDPAEILHSE